jgi:HlyD family secretion protein
VVIALVVALGYLGWSKRGAAEKPEVRLAQSTEKDVVGQVLARGTLKAKRQVDVGSELSGRISKVFVEVGDQVKKDDPLFSLEDTQSENALAQLRSAVTSAQAMVDRATLTQRELQRQKERDEKLLEKKVVSPEAFKTLLSRLELSHADVKQAQATLNRAQLEVQRAKDTLGKTTILAPMDGIVVDVTVEAGQVVSSFGSATGGGDFGLTGLSAPASGEQVVVADLSDITADLKVDELDIVRVKVGQKATVKAEGVRDESFDSRITRVGLLGRNESGAVLFNVKAHIQPPEGQKDQLTSADPDGGPPPLAAPLAEAGRPIPSLLHKLRPGMSVYAEIEVERAIKAVAIPVAAVLEGDGSDDGKRDRVFVAVAEPGGDDWRVFEKEVALGPADGDHVAITSGLRKGETVVEGPYRVLRDLKDGDLVKKESDKKKRRFGKKPDGEGETP